MTLHAAPSRPGFVPDPGADEIVAVFYSFQGADDIYTHGGPHNMYHTGMVTVENEQLNPSRLHNLRAETVSSELELLNRVADIVVDLDPDIIAGWEIQSASWGYLDARGQHYGLCTPLIPLVR
jgi:DNA polymerase zeta